jgi:hypothetical protein
MPRSLSKLHQQISKYENCVRNFEFAREQLLKIQATATPADLPRVVRALELNSQSLESFRRELAVAKEKLPLKDRTAGADCYRLLDS